MTCRIGVADVAAYAAAVRGTATAVIPCLGHYGDRFARYGPEVAVPPRDEWLRRADDYYVAGAAGLCVAADDVALTGMRLEDPDVMRLWERYQPPRGNSVESVADIHVAHHPPGYGF